MNEIEIKITKLDLTSWVPEMQNKLAYELHRGALAILRDAKVRIASGPKTGKIYLRGTATGTRKRNGVTQGRRRVQASAPGESPAYDEGNLSRSGGVRSAGFLHYQVYFSAVYARALEFGFAPRHLAARPFLRPAVSANRKHIQERIAKLKV
jgi:hypothetical protein